MTKKTKVEVAELEARFGYVFRDRTLLARALTHLSSPAAGGPDRSQSYQRLEFLGDRVLGVVVAHMLYEAYPQASEGELSMRLAKLVRRETCADVALEWDVGPHVAMGQGEARAGGRKKAAILADICEAIIGAVFLDAGFPAASKVVSDTWRPRMDADLEPERDAKTAVQEWAQARALPAPRYVEAARSGPAHAPHFVMHVVLDGYEPESGEANSKRAAEQAAAQSLSHPLERRMNETRCGFVALMGAPNAGKSTLLNALIGSKVTIVSRKAQTTRATVRGILMEGATQIIFVDTPGLFAPKRRLDRAMLASAWGAAGDADALALLIDVRQETVAGEKRGAADLTESTRAILEALRERKGPKFLVLNKIDLVERSKLLSLAERLNAALPFIDTFMISAVKGDGLDRLRATLAMVMPAGPWLYPEDQIADAPIRSLAAEITREKIFERLHDELPYQTTVETKSWKDQPDGSARVEQTIYVARESHKKIVIGEGGRTLKSIGSAARKEIAEANETKVHLFLFVKVRENWLDDPERYRAMGLEFPKQ